MLFAFFQCFNICTDDIKAVWIKTVGGLAQIKTALNCARNLAFLTATAFTGGGGGRVGIT